MIRRMDEQLNRRTPNRAVPNRLREWRIDHGLSLDEMSDLTGMSKPMLSQLERGLRGASRDAKVKIARRLEVSISDLFDLEPITEATA